MLDVSSRRSVSLLILIFYIDIDIDIDVNLILLVFLFLFLSLEINSSSWNQLINSWITPLPFMPPTCMQVQYVRYHTLCSLFVLLHTEDSEMSRNIMYRAALSYIQFQSSILSRHELHSGPDRIENWFVGIRLDGGGIGHGKNDECTTTRLRRYAGYKVTAVKVLNASRKLRKLERKWNPSLPTPTIINNSHSHTPFPPPPQILLWPDPDWLYLYHRFVPVDWFILQNKISSLPSRLVRPSWVKVHKDGECMSDWFWISTQLSCAHLQKFPQD